MLHAELDPMHIVVVTHYDTLLLATTKLNN